MRSDTGVTTGTVLDLTGTGLSIATDVPVERGTTIDTTSTVEDVNGELQFVKFHAIVRSCRAVPGAGWVLGTELSDIHEESWRRLMTFCYVVYPMRQLRARPESTPLVTAPARDSDAVLAELRDVVAQVEGGRTRPAAGQQRVTDSA